MTYKEKKRSMFLGLPWTFTSYTVTDEIITVDSGLLRKEENDCYLYKVIDVRLESTLMERILGLGTIHCFTGDVKDAFRFIELGFHLGIGGLVTYKENAELRSAVKEIPSERILLETDSPFLRPETCLEGNRNSPLNIPAIATEIAYIKGIEAQRVAEATTGNARELFKLY